MALNRKQLLLGIATYLPGVPRFYSRRTGGTVSARYCYSVWMRHLILSLKNGLDGIPKSVAELGPGESLGMGLAALISGAERYFAFDVVRLASVARNLEIFDELVTLFRNRERIPDDREFPRIKPYLDSYEFPSGTLSEEVLEGLLDETRIQSLRESILYPDREGAVIRYVVPWHAGDLIRPESVDMIFSQAVLEHVDDLEEAYRALSAWLKPGGLTSHQIDFKCHGLADRWNEHWRLSDPVWKLMRGRRPYLINREPCDTHLQLFGRNGLSVAYMKRVRWDAGIPRTELAQKYHHLSDEDLLTSGVFIIAKKQ